METLIGIVGQYAQWIYAICGFTALYNIYKAWQIRAERRQAVFTLERQKAVDDLYKILFTALILLAVMGTTYFSANVLAKAMGIAPPSRSISQTFGSGATTATQSGSDGLSGAGASGDAENNQLDGGSQAAAGSDDAAQNVNSSIDGADTDDINPASGDSEGSVGQADADNNGESSGSDDATNNDNSDLEATAAATDENADPSTQVRTEISVEAFPTATQPLPTPTFTYAPPPPAPPTITPTTAPIVTAPNCADPRSRILTPGSGSIVSGSFNIVGSATHEQFQFYKVEYAPGASADQAFVYLAGGNNPINGGVLATIDSTIWPNGSWTIRIVVVDQTGNFPPPCNVTITVSN